MISPTAILQHYMDMLPASEHDSQLTMPMPKLQMVNQLGSRWNGICISSNTGSLIKYQKSIASDETTLRRILAHEVCHAWAYWKAFTLREIPKFYARGHAATGGWAQAAHIINQHEGPNFITETSDETYVQVQERYYYLYLEDNPRGTWFAWFARMTPNLLRDFQRRLSYMFASKGHATIVKTRDARFLVSKAKLPTVVRATTEESDAIQQLIQRNAIPESVLGEGAATVLPRLLEKAEVVDSI